MYVGEEDREVAAVLKEGGQPSGNSAVSDCHGGSGWRLFITIATDTN